jgi:hypothetical protein
LEQIFGRTGNHPASVGQKRKTGALFPPDCEGLTVNHASTSTQWF